MDRFEENRDVNTQETASATGVNDVLTTNDYESVNAGGLFDKIMKKAGKISDVIGKGSTIVKGATDAYDSTKKKQVPDQTEEVKVDDLKVDPAKSSIKMPLIIGGVAIVLAIIGFVVYKKLKK